MLHTPKTPFMEAQEIAEALGLERATFMRQRNRLIINEGMPAPLPSHRPRWHRQGMEKWLAQYGEMKATAMRGQSSAIRIHVDRQALEANYTRRVAA